MSDVLAVSPPSSVAPPQTGPTPTPAGPGRPLLSDPSAGALGGMDPLSMLYLFESKDQQLSVDSGAQKIATLQNERHEALVQEEAAIRQAIDAQNNKSFWDDFGSVFGEVAKVAVVVASVAAAVASLGSATPIAALAIAGAVLSTASFADGELHVLHALGVDDATAGGIDLGMAIGGTVTSLGAGLLADAEAAAKVAGGAATEAARGSSTLSAISGAGRVVAGVSAVASASSGIAAGEALAQSDRAAADDVAARAQSDHAQRLMQVAIDDTRNSDQQARRILGTIANTKTIRDQTAMTAATAVRG